MSDVPAVRRVPSGVAAAVVLGFGAGAASWAVATVWPQFTNGYIRLDQWTMLTAGAIVGAATLGGHALRTRDRIGTALGTGALLGGVAALAVATLIAAITSTTSAAFVAQRLLGWSAVTVAVVAALTAALPAVSRLVWQEGLVIALVGGVGSGLALLLPGAPDFWQAIALVWFGVVVSLAVIGPRLWNAAAVVELVPPRNALPQILSLREWPLHEGALLAISTAQVACRASRVAIYPPAGGVMLNGVPANQATFLDTSCAINVGGQHYIVVIHGRAT